MKNLYNLLTNLVFGVNLEHYYKIRNIEFCEDEGKVFILVQVTGKNIWVKYLAQEIFDNKKMLNNFSPLDASIITQCALGKVKKEHCEDVFSNNHVELVAERVDQNGEVVLEFMDKSNFTHIEKLAKDLNNNKEFVSKLTVNSAYKTGIVVGYKAAEKLFRSISRLKKGTGFND